MDFVEYRTFLKHWAMALELIVDMAEFTGVNEQAVLSKMAVCSPNLISAWEEHRGTAKDFYRDNELYLYDLVDFNGTVPYFKYRLHPVALIHGARVLDIGCGLGTAVFLIADGGNEVVGYDVNQKLIDFCEFKKKKYNLSGCFTSEMPELKEFNHIVAIDTLEHIENLDEFLRMLGEQTLEGTMLLHCDCFGSIENSPMHFDNSAKIDTFLADAGFETLSPYYARKVAPNKVSV